MRLNLTIPPITYQVNKYQTTDPNFLPVETLTSTKTSKFIHEINWLMNQNESALFYTKMNPFNPSIMKSLQHHYLSTLNFNLFI